MTEVKNKDVTKRRGRSKKIQLPEELQKLVTDIENQQHEEFQQIKEEIQRKISKKGEWDFKIGDPIEFFDRSFSYELTGYKPIDKTHGLDFNPEWFTEARETFKKTGHYTSFRFGTKAYSEFWKEEYRRCRDGYTVNGYTVTGDHYFFLNYYQLLNTTKVTKAGAGRVIDFPNFSVAQYEYLHYVELAKKLKLHVALMKARGLGFSEMNASIIANMYSVRRNSKSIIAAHVEKKLTPTLEKIWNELSFLNDHTDKGFFKLRQALDKADTKRASYYKVVDGQKVEVGWMSQINGVIANTPDKIRGERVDLLVYEEAGSWGGLTKAVIQGEALVNILGDRFGYKIIGGTGGDRGPELEGLRKIYYDPKKYSVLPFRHNHTEGHSVVLTGYFLPAYSLVLKPGFMDSRGWCDPEKCKAHHEIERQNFADSPEDYTTHCAEYCFTAEEAFNLEGENKFNKVILAEQLTRIRALKECPNIDKGYFTFQYASGKPHRVEGGNVSEVVWHSDNKIPKVQILEHPVWTNIYQSQEKEKIKKLIEKGEDTEPFVPVKMQRGLYVIGVDGIDIGQAQTSENTKDPSDFCAVVFKRQYGMQDPQFVAVYKDRPNDLHEAYQTTIALSMYYNAAINIEATRLSFLAWSKTCKFLNYFMKRPRNTYTDITKQKSTQYGSPATAMVIEHHTELTKDFINDYGYTIWFEEMLEQLKRYSDEKKRKFDYVAAMGMALLADEELHGVSIKAVQEDNNEFQDIGYYFDERGYRRFGIIPKKNDHKMIYNPNYYDDDTGGVRTSNPRIYYQGDW